MDFAITDEQAAFTELAAQILRDGATHERMKALELGEGPRFDPALWKEIAGSGLLGIAIPESHGGGGQGFFELALIIEQIGRFTAPVPYLESSVLGALPITEFGSDAQKEALLPRIAEGELIVTAALVEDLTDPMRPGTTATSEGKGAFRLDGRKICVPAGQIAHRVLVPATADDGRVGVFIVDSSAQGVEIEPLITTSGEPEASLVLSGVRVEGADLLGDLASGGRILDWLQLRATAALCSLALGVCEEALRLTAEYTKTREQFGSAIATFQAVGQRQADAYVDTEAIRLTSWQAASRIGDGLDAESQVAVAKYYASLGGQRVVHTAVHQHGGMGVDRDYPLHRHFLFAKRIELALGGTTRQLLKIGKMLADEAA